MEIKDIGNVLSGISLERQHELFRTAFLVDLIVASLLALFGQLIPALVLGNLAIGLGVISNQKLFLKNQQTFLSNQELFKAQLGDLIYNGLTTSSVTIYNKGEIGLDGKVK